MVSYYRNVRYRILLLGFGNVGNINVSILLNAVALVMALQCYHIVSTTMSIEHSYSTLLYHPLLTSQIGMGTRVLEPESSINGDDSSRAVSVDFFE